MCDAEKTQNDRAQYKPKDDMRRDHLGIEAVVGFLSIEAMVGFYERVLRREYSEFRIL